MVEAMARGLPCIGSAVGGIPELLPADDLVTPGDAPGLARKLQEVLSDPARLARMTAGALQGRVVGGGRQQAGQGAAGGRALAAGAGCR